MRGNWKRSSIKRWNVFTSMVLCWIALLKAALPAPSRTLKLFRRYRNALFPNLSTRYQVLGTALL